MPTVTFEPGVRTDRLTPVLHGGQLRQANGENGLRLEYINGTSWDGDVVVEDTSPSSLVRFFGSIPAGVDPRAFAVRITGEFVPDTDGVHEVGVVSTGPIIVTAGGPEDRQVIVDDPDAQLPRSQEFFGYGSIEAVETIECTAGVPVPIELLWRTTAGNGFAAVRLGIRSPEPADLMDRAVAAATDADIAIVMVGTNDEWETEGFDRTTMDLPGRQDELVRRVCAANPRTAVIVNAGSPVTMDWAAGADAAPAVLTSFFAGQEQAEALVDVLFGVADPGGRLPLTIPARLEDHPARENEGTTEGPYGRPVQRYAEGLNVGYRGYEHRGVIPRFAFGHGLSYGDADWGSPSVDRTDVTVADPAVQVTVPVSATGDRCATAVGAGLRRRRRSEGGTTAQGTARVRQAGRRAGSVGDRHADVRRPRVRPLGPRRCRVGHRSRCVRPRHRRLGRRRTRPASASRSADPTWSLRGRVRRGPGWPSTGVVHWRP